MTASAPAGPPSGPPAGPAGPAGPAAPAPAPVRRRGGGTAGDMVRSVLVVLAIVLVLGALAAREQGRIERPVDVPDATARAAAAGLPVAEPRLPSGWEATDARYAPDTTEGLPTWHVGYLTPAEGSAVVDVTLGATPSWVEAVVGQGAEQQSEREVGGRAWQVLEDDGDPVRTSLLREQDGVTTVVSGRADLAELEVLAGALAG